MKILWQSPALWCKTGYATQSKRIIPHLQKMGHDVVVLATAGLEQTELNFMGVRHLPRGARPYSYDIAPTYFEKEKADLLITVQDNWVFPPSIYGMMSWMPWFPVDDDPVSPKLIDTLITDEKKPYTKKAAVYSKWGVEQLKKEGVESVYLPETVDIDIYKDMGMSKARKALGMPADSYVVGMVAANVGYPSRKAFDKNLIGFAKFAANHPEAVLYLHTNFDQSWREGDAVDLLGYLKLLSREYPILAEKGRVRFPDQYQLFMGIPDEHMAYIYSSFNVLLASTMAEGFGLPIIEAQSCGRPVIVTDFSSMPELVGAGWKVPFKDKFLTGRLSFQVIPDEDAIAEKLEESYQADGNETAKKAREFALQFSSPVVATKYWKPLLDSLK